MDIGTALPRVCRTAALLLTAASLLWSLYGLWLVWPTPAVSGHAPLFIPVGLATVAIAAAWTERPIPLSVVAGMMIMWAGLVGFSLGDLYWPAAAGLGMAAVLLWTPGIVTPGSV